jgi:exopolyphosphatase/guanosine-5'-triphosphate,3'-diphosphate pyrophosphatase
MFAEPVVTMTPMKVAAIDVGSNSIRMLVAERYGESLEHICQRKARVGLGADVERRGTISQEKLGEAADAVRRAADDARALGCRRIEVVVASPGRQAGNAGKLIRGLAQAARAPVRVLSWEEEARLAYEGALMSRAPISGTVAVCDVGGGSTQIAIGSSETGPVWLDSIDLGSLRLTVRTLGGDPPGKSRMKAARDEVRGRLDGLVVPLPMTALAVGGSARAAAKLVGPVLGPDEIERAKRLVRKHPASALAARFGIDPGRARALPAALAILEEVQRRFVVPLEVVPTGLREGLAVSLLYESSAA